MFEQIISTVKEYYDSIVNLSYNYLLIKYLIVKRFINSYINSFIANVIGFKSLKTVEYGNSAYDYSIWQNFRFYLYMIMMTKYINNYKCCLSASSFGGIYLHIMNLLDMAFEIIHIVKVDENGEKAIIIDSNQKYDHSPINFKQIYDVLNNTVICGSMSKHIFTKFDLVTDLYQVDNSGCANCTHCKDCGILCDCTVCSKTILLEDESVRICLRELLLKYTDPTHIYHNTLYTVLLFNDIDHCSSSRLHVKRFKDGRFENVDVELDKYLLDHIDTIMEVI